MVARYARTYFIRPLLNASVSEHARTSCKELSHRLQNPMPRASALASLVLAVAGVARETHAQSARVPFVQVSLGAGTSTGGDYEEREDYTAEFMLAQPLRSRTPHGLVAGLVAGTTFVNGSDLTCRLRADLSCVPLMPRFGYSAAVLGLERVGLLGTASVAAGPGLAAGSGRSLHPGLLYRADYSTPAIQHLSVVVSGRAMAITRVAGSTIVL